MIKVGEEVELIGLKEMPTKTTVTGVEMFRKEMKEAKAGENVGEISRYAKVELYARRQVLLKFEL